MSKPDYKDNDPRGWCGDPSRGAAMGRETIVGDPNYSGRLYVRKVSREPYYLHGACVMPETQMTYKPHKNHPWRNKVPRGLVAKRNKESNVSKSRNTTDEEWIEFVTLLKALVANPVGRGDAKPCTNEQARMLTRASETDLPEAALRDLARQIQVVRLSRHTYRTKAAIEAVIDAIVLVSNTGSTTLGYGEVISLIEVSIPAYLEGNGVVSTDINECVRAVGKYVGASDEAVDIEIKKLAMPKRNSN